MWVLPEEHRKIFKTPFGTLYRDMGAVIPLIAGRVVYTVGDVVTHNLQKKGITPAISIVDGKTMRSPCNRMPVICNECIRVKNPAGTIADELVQAIEEGMPRNPVTIFVDGEEDLAVIPLVLAAAEGATVLYGQPHEGVVLCTVDRRAKAAAQKLLEHFTHVEA